MFSFPLLIKCMFVCCFSLYNKCQCAFASASLKLFAKYLIQTYINYIFLKFNWILRKYERHISYIWLKLEENKDYLHFSFLWPRLHNYRRLLIWWISRWVFIPTDLFSCCFSTNKHVFKSVSGRKKTLTFYVLNFLK